MKDVENKITKTKIEIMKFRLFPILALMLILASCGKNKNQESVDYTPTVKTSLAESLSQMNKDYAGVVQTDRFSNLAFRVPGQLSKLNVVAGQRVKKGELIAELDTRDFLLQLDVDKYAYETSGIQLKRYKRLMEQEAISKQDFEIAGTNFEKAKATYENSANKMKDTKLYAPFTGSIEKKFVENFQKVQAGEPVVRLIDASDLFIWFTVSDKSWKVLEQKKEFYVEFDVLPGKKYKAKVKEILEMSPDGAGIPVTLWMDDSAFEEVRSQIKPGFSCRVSFNVELSQTNEVAVPLTAVFADSKTSKECVWVIEPNQSTVSLRNVTRGELLGTDRVTITEGLKAGEMVISAGVYEIQAGQKIKVLK